MVPVDASAEEIPQYSAITTKAMDSLLQLKNKKITFLNTSKNTLKVPLLSRGVGGSAKRNVLDAFVSVLNLFGIQ